MVCGSGKLSFQATAASSRDRLPAAASGGARGRYCAEILAAGDECGGSTAGECGPGLRSDSGPIAEALEFRMCGPGPCMGPTGKWAPVAASAAPAASASAPASPPASAAPAPSR